MKIEIPKHQASAIAGAGRRLAELGQHPVAVEIQTIAQVRKLFIDAMLRDMGHDPEKYADIQLELSEPPTLILTPKPE